MTRKQFVKIAEVMKLTAETLKMGADTEYMQGMSDTHYTVSHRLAEVLQQENPRFDRARFLAACGVGV